MNFFTKNQTGFGLDISSSSFKIFEFGTAAENVSIKCYSDILLPKGMIANDSFTDPAAFAALLKEAIQKPQFGKLSTNYAVVSLPEAKSFVRVIQIPQMSEAEAENAVPFEAESFIPMPVDQVYLDWQPLGTVGDKMNVLIIASPREFVDKYIEVIESAGIKIIAMEVESQSFRRALLPAESKETAVLIDLDAFRSSLIMVEDGNLQFTSTIPIAGNTFTESIARSLGISSAKAEMIKKKVGIANTTEYPNIKTALLPVLNNLSAEVKNILKFHSEHSEKQVTKIILGGGSAKIQHIADFLAPEFAEFSGLTVELGNPWNRLTIKNPVLDAYESLEYATVIGLALRGCNYTK